MDIILRINDSRFSKYTRQRNGKALSNKKIIKSDYKENNINFFKSNIYTSTTKSK